MDWYEGWVEFDGEARKMYVFCLRSMASGNIFCPWPKRASIWPLYIFRKSMPAGGGLESYRTMEDTAVTVRFSGDEEWGERRDG